MSKDRPRRTRRKRIPQICYHKGAGRYFVSFDRRPHYLGEPMPKQAKPPKHIQEEYERALVAFLAARAAMPERIAADPTIDELWLGYLSFVETGPKYKKHGKPTAEVQLIRDACRVVARLFGETRAVEFGPMKLKTVRAEFVRRDWTRETVNKAVSRVRRMFRWGVENELVLESVHRALQAVPDLTASEHPRGNKTVGDVTDATIERTLAHVPANFAAMVRAHRLIGCRAQEIVVARTCDFDRDADSDDVPESERCWLYTPSESKTDERYWVGPKAQAVLGPLLDDQHPDAWLFPTRQRGRGCWTTASYRRKIATVCREHGVPHWSPLMLRHAAAEEARKRHPSGLEAVQARLRHKEMNTSQIYAHDLSALGRDVARKLG